MKRLLHFFGRLTCAVRGVCCIVSKPVWSGSELIGWNDTCERCGESQFRRRWEP